MNEMSRHMSSAAGPNLAYLLIKGFRWFERGMRLDAEFSHLPPLTAAQLLALASLDKNGTSISELARRSTVTRQAMHQLVGDLQRMNLVETVDSPADKRVKLVKLTLLGRTLDDKAIEVITKLEEELCGRLGAKGVNALRDVLEKDWGAPVENARG